MITVSDLQEAENLILKAAQEDGFSEELKVLQNMTKYPSDHKAIQSPNQEIKTSSKLYRLDPFLDENGIIRVGGTIKRSVFSIEEIHPVLLPKDCAVTELLLSHFHAKCCHAGRNSTLNEIRASGYRIMKGRACVTSFIHKCVT